MPANFQYLAVDDDPIFQSVLSDMMTALGYLPPVCVSSAAEALERLSDPKAGFDAILLDIQMPEIDGIETCKRIRALPHHRETPIMMITTMNGRDYVDQAFAVGATDYLTKPVNRLELQARLSMLDRLIKEHSLARSLQYAIDSMGDLPGLDFEFEDAVQLPSSDMLIDFLALQNHLLTLNRLKLWSNIAMAFQVVGASALYNRLTRIEYLDFMADAGAAIASALKRHSFLLAHVGSGEFVCVLNRTQPIDEFEVELDIARELLDYAPIYESLGLPVPVVRVGVPSQTGLFSTSSVETLIERARHSVRSQAGRSFHRLAS